MTTQMPEPFADFAALQRRLDKMAPLDRAVELGKALKAIPDLQKWLKALRQEAVLEERANGTSYTDMAPYLGMQPERVSGIARGHSGATSRKAGSPQTKLITARERAKKNAEMAERARATGALKSAAKYEGLAKHYEEEVAKYESALESAAEA